MLGNKLMNIFRNASIGMTVKIQENSYYTQCQWPIEMEPV